MELKDFIVSAVEEVIAATSELSSQARPDGAIVNPRFMDTSYDVTTTIWCKKGVAGRRALTKIDFDIAIVATEESEKNKGAGIKIQVVNAGGSSKKTETNQTTSRIQFSLNVALPHANNE